MRLRLALDDDMEDEDEDYEGPLAKGIVFVSWLPLVMGKKGEIVSNVREVSVVVPLVYIFVPFGFTNNLLNLRSFFLVSEFFIFLFTFCFCILIYRVPKFFYFHWVVLSIRQIPNGYTTGFLPVFVR